jgi:hypothetical protein
LKLQLVFQYSHDVFFALVVVVRLAFHLTIREVIRVVIGVAIGVAIRVAMREVVEEVVYFKLIQVMIREVKPLFSLLDCFIFFVLLPFSFSPILFIIILLQIPIIIPLFILELPNLLLIWELEKLEFLSHLLIIIQDFQLQFIQVRHLKVFFQNL